jgi:hypothetical protein
MMLRMCDLLHWKKIAPTRITQTGVAGSSVRLLRSGCALPFSCRRCFRGFPGLPRLRSPHSVSWTAAHLSTKSVWCPANFLEFPNFQESCSDQTISNPYRWGDMRLCQGARASMGWICYHVLNRRNARQDVFHEDDDHRRFMELIREASARLAMQVLVNWRTQCHLC